MAEADAEAAFINSMQAMNNVAGSNEATGAASEQQTDYSSDEYDPAQAVQSSDPDQKSSLDSAKHDLPLSVPTIPVTSQSVSVIQSLHDIPLSKVQSNSRSMSRTLSVEENSKPEVPQDLDGPSLGDREQNAIVTQPKADRGLNKDKVAQDPFSRSVSNIIANPLSTGDVSVQYDVQHQDSSAVTNGALSSISNVAVSVPDVEAPSNPELTINKQQSVTQTKEPEVSVIEQAVPPTASAPRIRLPHDRIGILEDRIKEDPRGDLDAWLNLINEHKKRGKLEDARAVYERFFIVFPSAVNMTGSNFM